LGEFQEMPCGPGQPVQIFPKGARRISLQGSIGLPPGDPQEAFEATPSLHLLRHLQQSLFSFPPDDGVYPGMIPQDGFIVKRNVGSTPYGNGMRAKAFDCRKDLRGDRKIEGERSDSHNPGVQALKGFLHPADG
jgi:hypothetical protein